MKEDSPQQRLRTSFEASRRKKKKNTLKLVRGHRGDTAGVKMGVAVFSPCLLVVVDGCFSFLS